MGITYGGLQIDEFASKRILEDYPQASECTRLAWIYRDFQDCFKKDIDVKKESWIFRGTELSSETQNAIEKFATEFYQTLTTYVNEYVRKQSEGKEIQVMFRILLHLTSTNIFNKAIILTGGVTAATLFQKLINKSILKYDFSSQRLVFIFFRMLFNNCLLDKTTWSLVTSTTH
jgi:hypothetical protein